ncbi:TIGR02444 family protein [Chenggangzhangella methanolivorans]|uniref:TIGR02444 family protein n=1 Tax=Chenggangzhangella methanolivorans TaxID=1437009 RepID=A0A9E6RDD7_9HYPH|nr:TIGR02444 family protein [Chenggangzhangella methanolivorans]QZO01800.1 TIGR02444 family protein [Chenggangzhangella methanolivorans]
MSEACLALQDEHGQDVNVVLFAAWAGAELGRRLGAEDVARARGHVAEWRDAVVAPLRAVRRAMKRLSSPPPGHEELRSAVKAVELQSELLQLAMLDGFAQTLGAPAPPGPELAEANLRAVVAGSPESASAAVSVIVAACRGRADASGAGS